MAAKQNSTTGMVRTEDVAKILPVAPLISSDQAGWNNIFLAYYQQPACEIPKHYLSQHTLTICGELSTPALIECCLDDRLKRYWFDSGDKVGETVGDNGIVELGQTDQMQVVAEVYQTDIANVRQGQQATITGESFVGEVRGSVDQIGLQVSQQEVVSGTPGENLDRRIVEVRIHLTPEDSKRVAKLTNLQVQVAIKL
jgi:hypothetical protein